MNKNIHMPGAAGEWRKGGLERKDAGESLGRHQFTHFRFSQNLEPGTIHCLTPWLNLIYYDLKPSQTGNA